MKKSMLIMTLLVLCLLTVTACGHPKIVGVKSLVAANASAQSKVKNYHMDGTVNMDIALDSEVLEDLPLDPKLPVNMTLAADAGTNTAHVTTEAGVSLFDQSVVLQTTEIYMDMENQVAYTKAGDSQEWEKVDDQKEQKEQLGLKELVGGIAVVGKTVLENTAFEESDEFYTLTMPAEKAGDLITDLNLIDSVDVGIADVRDITVEGGQIIYNVDKETLLVSSIQLKDVDVRGTGVYEETSVDLKFPINADFQFSRYNELEEAEYAIPEEVKGTGE